MGWISANIVKKKTKKISDIGSVGKVHTGSPLVFSGLRARDLIMACDDKYYLQKSLSELGN